MSEALHSTSEERSGSAPRQPREVGAARNRRRRPVRRPVGETGAPATTTPSAERAAPTRAEQIAEIRQAIAGDFFDDFRNAGNGTERDESITPEMIAAAREAEAAEPPREIDRSVRPPQPPPPFDAKFARNEPTYFGEKNLNEQELPLERILHLAILRLFPETVDAETAHVITDLVSGHKPVHCVRAGLSEHELKYVWEPQIEGWWSSLGDELREKFVAAAHRVNGTHLGENVQEDPRLKEARMIGYRRLLNGIFAREPMRMYATYETIKNGQQPFCPDGFTEQSCGEWRDFLNNYWFAHLSTDQKIRIDGINERQRVVPGLLAEKQAALGAKREQLRKTSGLLDRALQFFFKEKRAERERIETERDTLMREVRELEREVLEFHTSAFIDQEIAREDSALHVVGDRAGFGPRVLDTPHTLFSWIRPIEKTHVAGSLDGQVLSGLTGARHNVPAVIERWMLEAGSAQAAAAMNESDRIGGGAHAETPHDLLELHRVLNEEGRPSVDWQAYLFSLQQQITIEIARALQKSQQLRAAVEKEPLSVLLKAYRDALPYVMPDLREQQARVTTYVDELLAQTENDLRHRVGSTTNITNLVSRKDKPWVASLLEARLEERLVEPAQPSAHPEQAADRVTLGFKHELVVAPGQTPFAVVREVLKAFDKTKNDQTLNRDTEQFLVSGWVFEVGDKTQKHLTAADGKKAARLYTGDRVTALQDASAPGGVRLDIMHDPAPKHEGYFEDLGTGTAKWYYERLPSGTVRAWEVDGQGALHFAGHFEGKKFVERPVRQWMYVSADGKKHTVGQFQDDIYFKPDGTVVAERKNENTFSVLGKLAKGFERRVTIKKADDTTQEIDLHAPGHTYYITPAYKLVEYHASVNEMRILGSIEG